MRIGRNEPGYDDVIRGSSAQRVPARRKWDHCDICLRLTGTQVRLGGNAEYKRQEANPNRQPSRIP